MSDETSLVRQTTIIAPRSLDEVVTLAERIAKSGLLPKELQNKVPEVMMQIMAGQELGLAPMASLRSFSIINGKPVMSADAMVAIVLGSGKCEYFHRVGEGSDKSVTYATKRKGREEQRCTWTMEMAKTAALHQKDNWRTFPRAMLAARAKSELARDVYEDILAGVFTAEEIASDGSATTQRGHEHDVIDAEFTDSPPTPPPFNVDDYPEIAELGIATTIEACKEVAGRFAKRGLKPGHPAYEAMNGKYKAQVAELKKQRPTSGGSSSAEATTPTNSGDSSTASTGPEAA